ncbi:hypothetical protein A7U60_g6555 [Sanghuangporus baumii]|uniref:Micro-fibrillar-associated protein 1 C-terminal domain-containing protein n=1 Tax=Sanghuangporus baumii TaxID=108892 RepID=A0A9Q5NAH9_SANBA|nr:hypothetical protein A7U60_g6555 [Sanghuangporus baumii]
MSTVVRKPAAAPRPARPAARYWRGKAPKGVAELSESEEEDEFGEAQDEGGDEDVDMPLGAVEGAEDDEEDEVGQETATRAKTKTVSARLNIALKDVDIKDGKVIIAGREESGKTAMEESEEESEEEEDDGKPSVTKPGAEAEEESSEYESSSEEEEEPPKPMFRPVFIPKRGRVTVLEKEKEVEDSEEALERRRLQEEERKKQSHDLVAESIRRELAEKEKEKETPDVDDADGLDPEGEFEAWRLRELSRIKRDKEAEAAREREREEIERRRALPEEQRLKEDLEHAKETRESKSKGKQKFLQKYWHKGAFHQDDEVLKKHDYTEATESAMDVSLLPKVMQVRDFGKRSRTKWTHLVNEDTTVGTGGFGGVASFAEVLISRKIAQITVDLRAREPITPTAPNRCETGVRITDVIVTIAPGGTEIEAPRDAASTTTGIVNDTQTAEMTDTKTDDETTDIIPTIPSGTETETGTDIGTATAMRTIRGIHAVRGHGHLTDEIIAATDLDIAPENENEIFHWKMGTARSAYGQITPTDSFHTDYYLLSLHLLPDHSHSSGREPYCALPATYDVPNPMR